MKVTAAIAASILLVSAAQAEPLAANSEKAQIANSEWNLSAPEVPPFAKIRADLVGGIIVLRPNVTKPGNSFGFIEGPLISTTAGDAEGDFFVLQVEYTHSGTFTGVPPVLRIRLNSENFNRYVETALTSNQIAADGGGGTIRAYFDRNLISSTTNIRPFIDLLAIEQPDQPIDPNFEINIVRTDAYTLEADAGTSGGNYFSVAYLEKDGDLFAHINGNTGSRFRLRGGCEGYAYSSSYVLALDGDVLYGYAAGNPPGAEFRIDDTIKAVAVAGDYAAFVQDDGDVFQYDLKARTQTRIADGADGVAAGPDGITLIALDYDLGDNAYQAFQWTPPRTDLQELVGDYDIRQFTGRMSQHYKLSFSKLQPATAQE